MTPQKGKKFRTSERVADLTITHRHAAGIDVHAAVHFVAVAAEDVPAGFINPDTKLPKGVRKFGTNTGDLEAIAAWLKDCGVTTVAIPWRLSFFWQGPGRWWSPNRIRTGQRNSWRRLFGAHSSREIPSGFLHSPGNPARGFVPAICGGKVDLPLQPPRLCLCFGKWKLGCHPPSFAR
jgi:hypothetical protein